MRYVILVVVSLAVGFGAGFLVFDWPFGDDGGGGRDGAIADQLLQDLRRQGATDADSATCVPRQASADHSCTVLFSIAGSSADIRTYVVHPDGSYDGRG